MIGVSRGDRRAMVLRVLGAVVWPILPTRMLTEDAPGMTRRPQLSRPTTSFALHRVPDDQTRMSNCAKGL
eukprot:6962280-Pyramimonas_sp.AAC.1